MKIFILNIFVFVLRFLLKFLDKILSLLNYNFFYFRIVDKLKNEYSVLKFDNKEIKFYTPSYISRWRASNVFTKEPETIAWIKNFQLIILNTD